MTANTAQLAATLASLAALLADQQTAEPPQPEQVVRAMPERVLLTVEEAAECLGIGRTKTYSLVRDGELESVQIGRLRRVPKNAIEDYAARLVQRRPSKA
ncbi:helix-turn-helix domain-containing protein [Saccharopolyspora dendranthemae]|uniref:Excisionase family DNA binding protein n=1 Tax=Saccharopolyspora dendranthemae TaxID=1181886 RepID=A0A561U4X3_9PSEU|nr:helix-turn-helix domain-containing protein [Saccharopolyspora dendranthemae]TWF94417.1 excisionase family DNA binding protein [Saccharopolyspora dendranthemae]